MPGEITRRTWVRFPLGMSYQFLIIEIWLFQEETFSCQNWCICNAQLVYIYIWFENVNTWNVNEDAVIFLCDSAYLAGHWQHFNLKWIWMIVSRTSLQQWKIYAFAMHSWCIFYLQMLTQEMPTMMQWVSFVLALILWDKMGAARICGIVSWCPALPIYHATLGLV